MLIADPALLTSALATSNRWAESMSTQSIETENRAMPNISGSARDQLKAIVARIERLEEEKAATSSDIRDVYAEAKAMGFDPKILRTVVRLLKQDASEREEHEAVLATYMHALGMAGEAA